MNTARLTKNISEVSDEMKELWEWYGLELMVYTARKDWPWKSKLNRISKRFSECVSIGDEALALQIIILRGKMYVTQRNKEALGVEVKVGRCRKKAESGEEESYAALTSRFDVFKAMRGLVAQIRERTKGDELGWEAHLMDQMVLRGVTVTLASAVAGGTSGLINQDEDQVCDFNIV
jgi:hypothetical protein